MKLDYNSIHPVISKHWLFISVEQQMVLTLSSSAYHEKTAWKKDDTPVLSGQINVCNFVVPTWFIILHISTMALQGNRNYWIVINAFIAKFELIS